MSLPLRLRTLAKHAACMQTIGQLYNHRRCALSSEISARRPVCIVLSPHSNAHPDATIVIKFVTGLQPLMYNGRSSTTFQTIKLTPPINQGVNNHWLTRFDILVLGVIETLQLAALLVFLNSKARTPFPVRPTMSPPPF